LSGSDACLSKECGTSADSVSYLTDNCSNVAVLDTAAGFAVDNSPSAGCFSQSRSSVAQLDSCDGLTSARDSCEPLSCAPARHNITDWRSKPSIDVPQPISTSATDLPNTSRSVECVLCG